MIIIFIWPQQAVTKHQPAREQIIGKHLFIWEMSDETYKTSKP
jgi:hypothetical protein